ncbi:MAG: type phosphodiesterase/nucleotide pyrophosphatase [Bacteroidetes bacterium]|jgi:hypothetical protein|nr:type phosphodiesterase/nucleotide pyrophosphatase [Bacteroidota bacterium]
MKLYRFFIIYLFAAAATVSMAQKSSEEPPRLVVGIMVDGLQQKHLDLLWSYFDPNGFRKIAGQGASLTNVTYNFVSAGSTPDIASVMTGSTPYYHGVTGDFFYSRLNDKVQSVIADDQQIGIGTQQTVSAHHLYASTILDELSLAFPGKSKNYAVAIDAEEAIMLGGHTARGVAWIDDEKLKWVTTGYYRDGLPRSADEMNVNGAFKSIASRDWRPLYAISTYLSAAKSSSKDGFKYTPTDRKQKNMPATILKNTPSANSLVAELGLKIIADEKLGTDNVPDMLMLQFTVRAPKEKFFSLQSPEKEDMYLRLDRDIQNILQKIDAQVGLDKTLVFLFTNQTDVHSPTELGENNIPAGYFSAGRSMALVNTYLMALYGQEKWIKGYYGKNIFLNKQKIDEKKLNFREIQQNVADFMHEFEGIQTAYPSWQILTMAAGSGSEMARIRNSMHKNSMGDVVITLLPGWLEVDDKLNPVGESNAVLPYTPIYFYGWQIKPQHIKTPYQVTDIAPTLSRILNIPMPNACIGKPVSEL